MFNLAKQLLYFTFFIGSQMLFAQKKGDLASNKILNFQFIYQNQSPQGDWEKLYGISHGMGVGFNYKSQTNWAFSAETCFMLSGNLKGGVNLINLTNSNGFNFNSNNGTPATVDLSMRGFNSFAKIGKIFPVSKYNKNHGIFAQVGLGYLMHYLNFNIPQSTVAQLNEDYQKGYDRLHGGIATSQFLGYYFHSESRLINFCVGLEFVQGYTKNLREFNYDTQAYDLGNKQDNFAALRLMWMIPIYLSNEKEEFIFKND
jgi:hypothetical protein